MIATQSKTGLLRKGESASRWSSSLIGWVLSRPQFLFGNHIPAPVNGVLAVSLLHFRQFSSSVFVHDNERPFDFKVQASAKLVTAGFFHKHLLPPP